MSLALKEWYSERRGEEYGILHKELQGEHGGVANQMQISLHLFKC